MKSKIQSFLKNIFLDQEYISKDSETLKNKVVMVTGETGGIGSAIVEVLLKNGAYVVGVSRGKKILNILNDRFISIRTDITIESEIKFLINHVNKKFGRIDVLINNAGMFSYGPIEDITENEFEKVTNLNIKGPFLLSKAVVPIMKKQKFGTIINIGSKISRNTKVEPNKTLYALTKYAIEGFSFALNRELKSHGIRVVCLMPGTVNTFVSLKSKTFMSPFDVAEVVNMIIKMEHVDFESIVFKSKKQDI